jgi:hypothetical protein
MRRYVMGLIGRVIVISGGNGLFRVSVEDVPANLTGMQNQTNNRLAVENLFGTVSLAVERLVYTQ